MNKEDIIRMAREANASFETAESMFKFAVLVAAEEREACARMVEDDFDFVGDELIIAEAIRASGQPLVCCEEYNTCVRPCTPRGRHHGQEAEREACAKVCEGMEENNLVLRYEYRRAVLNCADAIRERGKA